MFTILGYAVQSIEYSTPTPSIVPSKFSPFRLSTGCDRSDKSAMPLVQSRAYLAKLFHVFINSLCLLI